MDDFVKVVRPGRNPKGRGRAADVYCKITYKDGRLSIIGVDGPHSGGDCAGSCGQICDTVRELTDLAPGWTPALLKQFCEVWDRWHLNDMRAGSPAQEEFLRRHPVNAVYPESHYDKAKAALEAVGLEPLDGHSYGSAWKREAVPEDVLTFLAALPIADKTPAWV